MLIRSCFHISKILLISTFLLILGCSRSNTIEGDKLNEGFKLPPDSIQTSVYWYWISDNISKEGVVKDLQAMKSVGINRAFIGNIGLDNVPYGEVKMLSEEWWEIIHLTLKTATELGIEIGIFNSPGWSQSGGPWVKAENAMRYLSASQTKISGPALFNGKLERPNELFQDVKVLAFPVPKYKGLVLEGDQLDILSVPAVSDLKNLIDANPSTGVVFPTSEDLVIEITSNNAFTARSMTIQYAAVPIYAMVSLQVKNDQGEYQTHKKFEIDRTKFDLEVGFKPLAPLQVSFEEITSKRFRLVFDYQEHTNWPTKANNNPKLNEITISSEVVLGNYAEKSLAKMHPTPMPQFNDYNWDKQNEPEEPETIIDPSKVIDISEYLNQDGTLIWDVPEGEWIVLRTGMTPTGVKNSPASPEATGFEVDKMSKDHVEKHFFGHIGEILKRVPEEDRITFKVVVQDSYEKGGQNFTDGFLESFENVYGYDPVPFLPTFEGLVVKSQQASDRFLWDVRRLVADRVAYDYVGGLREISHQHGLTTWLENYGHWGFPGEFLQYGGQSDEISGEFWSEGNLGNIENRAATSCGHIYGKTKISAESFTCGGKSFSRSPSDMKSRGDLFFAEGINNTLLHVFIHQPYDDKNPGINAWFGNPFNRKNTWFTQLDVFIDYLKRTNFMLQQGLNVADVAYFIGEDAPIMTGTTDPPLPIGYEFDYINAEVILNSMTVEDGLLKLPHGTQYHVMVLPKRETMTPELLDKIKSLIAQGGIILGSKVTRSPSGKNQPLADENVARMAAELWGEVDDEAVKSRAFGKGKIMSGMTMKEVFESIQLVPDCKLPEDNSIHYGHRDLGEIQIYFLSNQTDSMRVINPAFRITGMQPELWEATTGYSRALPAFKMNDKITSVPLRLAPNESVFIVFRKEAKKTETKGLDKNYPNPRGIIDLKGPWQVSFEDAIQGEKTVKFDQLIDWTLSKDDLIRYYSGTADYQTTFSLGKGSNEKVMLDLGNLTSMAKVYLNETYVGGVWTAPYTLDISGSVKEGENVLRVEVVNNWMNRLIGDQHLPESERTTWSPVNPYKANSKLQRSGLFGPVSVYKLN